MKIKELIYSELPSDIRKALDDVKFLNNIIETIINTNCTTDLVFGALEGIRLTILGVLKYLLEDYLRPDRVINVGTDKIDAEDLVKVYIKADTDKDKLEDAPF